ncbi:MAG: hypothetical protein KY429_00690 [Actinobacteria bacterium]|nr:hypothetical protein [Actinomycetota bacterium]
MAAGPFAVTELLDFCRYVKRRELVRSELAWVHSPSVAQPAELAPIIAVAEQVEEQAIPALESGEETLSVSLSLTPQIEEMISWIRKSGYLRLASDLPEGHIHVYWSLLDSLAEPGAPPGDQLPQNV